jgi:hypothetical protein
MADSLNLELFAIARQCIQTLTLYDAAESDCGCAELRSTAAEGGERWHCEVRAKGQIYTKQAASFNEALAYLKHKRDELFPGGLIVAFAEFQIDPAE